MNLTDLMTAEQVAEALCCDITTVASRTLSGDLPGVKFGRGWVYPRNALLKRLDELALAEADKRAMPKTATQLAVSVRPASNRTRARPILPSLG